MAEEPDRSSTERQATWVALKTLRQRPTVVGRTEEGIAVYGIRSVEMVLPPGAAHFKRLVPCAKCGRRVPGMAILGPADLDRSPTPVFCDRCGRPADRPASREAPDVPAPAPPPASRPVVAEGAVDAERLAAVEAQLAEVLSRAPSPSVTAGELRRLSEHVAELLRAQKDELATVAASVAEVRAEMRTLGESNRALDHALGALDQTVVGLAARVAAPSEAAPQPAATQGLAELRAGVTDMIDTSAQTLHAALHEGLDHLGAEIASMRQRLDDESAARSEVGRVAEANRERAALADAEIEQKLARELVGVGTSLAATLAQGLEHLRSEMAALERRVDESAARSEIAEPGAGVVDTIGAEHAQHRVEVAERLGLLRAEIGLLERRNQEERAEVAALLEAQRKELGEALHDVAHETLMSVAEPLRELTKAREAFERRLESLQQRAQDDQRRVAVLKASADAWASKLHALEDRVQGFVQKRRPAKPLLESLEQQLREAEERLGQL